MTRDSRFGQPFPQKSALTQVRFAPLDGYTELPDVLAPPSSIVSGQNMWVRNARLEPRWRLASAATNNVLVDVPVGAWLYHDIEGVPYTMVASKATLAYLAGGGEVPLRYVSGASGGMNRPPSGGENAPFFSTSVYLPRRDLNIGIFVNGEDPPFAWAGPSDGTAYSTLTGAPIAADVALLDNRPVFWNVYDDSSGSRFVQRVQWPVGGDPEDYAGIGSGSEDLVDMHGNGTRIFAQEDQLVLASDQELWRGRRVGDAFIFNFSPISKQHGIPWPRAALQTPLGLFWLNSDYMICRLYGETLDREVGKGVQRTLRDTLVRPDKAFFGYNPLTQQVTLYYQTAADADVQHAFTLNVANGVWTPQTFGFGLRVAVPGLQTSSATTWGALVGSFASQTFTFGQLLGAGTFQTELLFSSTGSALAYTESALSDSGLTVLAQACFGALWSADPQFLKLTDEVRVDFRAASASSLSVSVSGNLGGSYQNTQQFLVSVVSASTQARLPCTVPGAYHALKLESESGRWEVTGLSARAQRLGYLR